MDNHKKFSVTLFFRIIASPFKKQSFMILRLLRAVTVLAITFTLFCCTLSGQSSKADSLKNILKNHTVKDTTRVNILNKIAYSLYSAEPEQSKKYATESYNLAIELGYSKGQAESLWLQGISFIKTDPEKALSFFENAMKFAEKIGCKQAIGKYANAIGTAYGARGRDSAAVCYYLKAIDIAKEINDSKELGKYLLNLSQAYNRMGKVDLAVQGFNDALDILKGVDDKTNIALCYNSLGNIYSSRGNYPAALEFIQNGLRIWEEMQDMKAVTKSLISIGGIYFTQKDFSKALEYNQKVVELAEQSNEKHTLAGSLLNIGTIYLHTNNKQALDYFRRALEISNNLNITPLKTGIVLSIGQYYFNESEYEKALESFSEALELSEIAGIKSNLCISKFHIARVYLVRKEFSRALGYAQSSLEMAKEIKLIETEKDLHKILAEIYAGTNNYKSAYTHSLHFKQLSDSIFNENNFKKITELEFTYNFEKERQAIALEQQKRDELEAVRRRIQRSIIATLAACFLLVSMLAVYIHRLYRFNKKANLAIREMEQEKKRLLEHEIDLINQELEENQKALTAASLKLIQNSERDAETVRRLEAVLESTSPEGKRVILGIISDFKRISRSSNWNEFELLFQKVHKSFYDKLNENFPDLTANERKLCAFLKLNMSSKDIANITFQSEEALKKARQRLRQKLGIDRDTNLSVYLQNI